MKSFEDGRPQVILGDFNSGPAIPSQGIHEAYPATYQKFLDKGWRTANTWSPAPFCTWCPQENDQITDPDAVPQILSHVFTKGVNMINPKRFWDFQNLHDTPYGVIELFPSDHFAYRNTVTWPHKGDDFEYDKSGEGAATQVATVVSTPVPAHPHAGHGSTTHPNTHPPTPAAVYTEPQDNYGDYGDFEESA
jgi:hypothetical protein